MNRDGFTTVELLVTLFIAAMMVISGYQLYSTVSQRGGRTRSMAEASNLAYSKLRENSNYTSVTNSCLTQETIGEITTTISGTTIPGPVSLVIRRCKPFTANNIVRVTAIVRYDSPVKEVAHAVYVAP